MADPAKIGQAPIVNALRVVEQALYMAEVDGLLKSAGRQQIANRIVDALVATADDYPWKFECTRDRSCLAMEHAIDCIGNPAPAPSSTEEDDRD